MLRFIVFKGLGLVVELERELCRFRRYENRTNGNRR